MGIQAYVDVSADQVAAAMIEDPEFAMDVLAELANSSQGAMIHEGDTGSTYHSAVAPWLEKLAARIRANA